MGTEKYISEVKFISSPQDVVFNHLADMNNLSRFFDPSRIEEMKLQYPDYPDIKLDNFIATTDECSFSINPIGTVGVRIVEREPSKLIKLAGSKSVPFKLDCWIQLLPVDVASCKLRITLHAELNAMIKMLVDKPLKESIDRVAEALARIQYT
jgi:hypothetical protein